MAETTRVRLGELLVQAGAITQERLDEALALQKAEGGKRRLGQMLVDRGFIDETALTQQLGRHLSVPWVSLYHVDFSRQLLNLVPREVAESYGLIPVYVRHVRGQGETLYVATDDPTNDEGLRRIAAYAGLPARPMIASASDIRHAIRVYYGGERIVPAVAAPVAPPPPVIVDVTPPAEEPATKREVPADAPEPPKPQPPPPEPAPAVRVEPVAVAPAAPPAPAYDDMPEIEATSIKLPERKKKGRAIALTFLDGTTISLPAPRGRKKVAEAEEPAAEPAEHETQLTASDLVAALRAVANGAEAAEVLGETPRWEKLFAALLSVLLKKRLIADWEFVEELKKL